MGIADLGDQEGWRVENRAARVHYDGDGARVSVEYYGPGDCVLYWRVTDAGELAVPVDRDTVPGPLRERIRADLEAAGIDPGVESKSL